MNKLILLLSVRNILYVKTLFLLLLIINSHKTAPANSYNLQVSDHTCKATINENYNPEENKSFIDFLSQKLNVHCNECVEVLDKKVTDANSTRNSKQTRDNAIRSLLAVNRIITELIDKFRISINKDFEILYNQLGIQNQDPDYLYHDDMYNLCTIYNFTMLKYYKSHVNTAAEIINKANDFELTKETKLTIYQQIIISFEITHEVMLQNLSLLCEKNKHEIKTDKENSYNNNSDENIKHNAQNSITNDSASIINQFRSNKEQTKLILKKFIYSNFEHRIAALTVFENNEYSSEQKKNVNKFLKKTNIKLKTLLTKLEKRYIYFEKNKQQIINEDINDPKCNKHFIDKFSCFYLTIKSFAKVFEICQEKCQIIIPENSNAITEQQKAELYYIKNSTEIMFKYIKHTTEGVLYVGNDQIYIDPNGDVVKNGAKVTYNDIDVYLYVFAINPMNKKSLKVKRNLYKAANNAIDTDKKNTQ